MKKLLFILTAFIWLNAFAAHEGWSDCDEGASTNCEYRVENGILTVKPYDATLNGVIPNYTRACDQSHCYTNAPWFSDTSITKIDIKDGISDIGAESFSDMFTVTAVELPEGLKTIKDTAFHSTSIQKIDLPSTLISIGAHAFSIDSLKEINAIPSSVTTIEADAFSNTKIKDFVIGLNVTTLSPNAFGTEGSYSAGLIENLYCEESMVKQCEAALAWKNALGKTANVITYQKNSNGQYFYKNHWYSDPNDILSDNHIKKRIYTVEEANQVAGPKNRVSIKYR